MITAYTREGNHVLPQTLEHGTMPPADTLWVDLLNPDDHERIFISTALGIDLPNVQEMQEIEASSRLYAEGDALYLTTDIMVGFDTPDPELGTLLAVLAGGKLVTVRYCEPRAISIFADRIKNQPALFTTADDGLLALLDAMTDRTADILETLGRQIDDLSRHIFRPTETQGVKSTKNNQQPARREKRLQEILMGIGRAGDTTHKIRDSINDMMRLVTFLGYRLCPRLNTEQLAKHRALEIDLRSLSEHAQFMAHETTFLLDATLGQINIEQNAIIKIFSIVSVVFLPPTLFASIWGMNFQHMPELSSPHGYAIAIGVILVSALMPLAFFKHKGWL